MQPLVSIITPVYNGADYLAECIESVLAQTYQNWDYTILNNCSTDESLAIAQKYAAADERIHVVNNNRFLRIIENHNEASRQIAPDSKYCKFVFADDRLYANCLEEMVSVAEKNPTVGLVGSYTTNGSAVIWSGPAYPSHRVPGREVCRQDLMGGPYVFGTMTSLLVRSDLIRKRPEFFNEKNLHADYETCIDVLQESDFAFIHQVLCFSRPAEKSTGTFAASYNSITLGAFVIFLKYGRVFLSPAEYRRRYPEICWKYHRELGHNVLRFRSQDFWKYHQDTLAAFGGKIDKGTLAAAVIVEGLKGFSRPVSYFKNAWNWWSPLLRKVAGRRRVQAQRTP